MPEPTRLTLPNGLRVVLAPDPATPAVAVVVHYDVGFRSEPQGRTGFAHLFEHLMFQGSESLPKLEHSRLVQGSGGAFNGSTRPDFTEFHNIAPAPALERLLFLEADRMRAPSLTAANLANQVDVVKEEIRLNVLSRPYGGLPWILLPPVMFDLFANTHNGYGDFSHLQEATVADCVDFFDRYYTPANAVLTVAGCFEADAAAALVERHFGDVPHRPAPPVPSFGEPPLRQSRWHRHHDPRAPLPALSVGYRLPDAASDLGGYLAWVVLSSVLSGGDSARLRRTLVQRDGVATDLSTGCGLFGAPLDARAPEPFIVTAFHPAEVPARAVLDAVAREVGLVADNGLEDGELAGVQTRWRAEVHRHHDRLADRAVDIGTCELLFGRPDLTAQLPGCIAQVTEDQVRAAARDLLGQQQAVLEVVPGAEGEVAA